MAVLLLTFTFCKRTAAQSGMPDELRELLKQALSEAAGLDGNNLEEYSPNQQQAAVPQFMLDMYDCWNTIDDDNETNVLQQCRRAIVDEEEEELPKVVQEADTILTFQHEGMNQHHTRTHVRPGPISAGLVRVVRSRFFRDRTQQYFARYIGCHV